MLRKLQVLAAASRLRTFTVAELARASDVTESTVHTVLQRSPNEWFYKLKTTTGARGGQPHRIELTAVGAAGINERLGKLPNTEPLMTAVAVSEGADLPMGILAARASLQKLGDSPATEEELRDAALRSLDWAEAELNDGDFADHADNLRVEIRELRRELAEGSRKQLSRQDPRPHILWISRFATGLRSLATSFEFYGRRVHRRAHRKVRVAEAYGGGSSLLAGGEESHGAALFTYFGSDARSREMASFAAGALANEMHHRLGQAWTLPSEAHELLKIGENEIRALRFDLPRQLFLCISTPRASEELNIILKQTRLLIDRRCFAPESLVLDFDHSKDVERVTKLLALNYAPNARQPSNWSRWLDQVFATAARSPLSPGALPFKSGTGLDSKAPETDDAAPPTARLTIRGLSASAFLSWTSKHSKGTMFEATVRQVDAHGATIDLGGGVQGYLKASELSGEPEDVRHLFRVDQKVRALYMTSSRKRRTIAVLVDAATKDEQKPRYHALKRAATDSAPRKLRSKSQG